MPRNLQKVHSARRIRRHSNSETTFNRKYDYTLVRFINFKYVARNLLNSNGSETNFMLDEELGSMLKGHHKSLLI